VAGSRRVRTFDPGRGGRPGGQLVVSSVAFSPDGKELTAARHWPQAFTFTFGGVCGWDVASGKSLRGNAADMVRVITMSPDGRTAALWSEGGAVHLWEPQGAAAWRLVAKPDESAFTRVAFSGDGRAFAAAIGRELLVIELLTGGRALALAIPEGEPAALALSPDGRRLAEAHPSGAVLLRDVLTGKVVRELPSTKIPVRHMAFSPDGRRLVTAGEDTYALLWDVAPKPKPKPLEKAEAGRLWEDLGGDAATAWRAVARLAEAPAEAAALLRGRVRPVAADGLARLLADLDSKQFAARENAARELAELGRDVEPALREAMGDKGTSLEKRRRLERLLADAAGPFPAETLRALRAVAVLEHLATPAAREVLRSLAGGAPAARRTQEARAALARLAPRGE
jgi:hypothetical protein